MNSSRPPGLDVPKLMTPPEPFGYKTAWYAIRSKDRDAVATALELQAAQEVNWQYGVHRAYEYNEYLIFVAPPVNGWVLAMGTPVLFEIDDYATERITKLSRQFGEAQCFGSVRTSNCYSWALARDGLLVRHFYDADGNHGETGEYTGEERTLGAKFSDSSSGEAMEPGYWERKDIVGVEEQTVLQIAGLWSGIRCAAGHCGNRAKPLGARLSQSAAGVFLWEKWAAGPTRNSEKRAVWKNCFREYGPCRGDGSSVFHTGSASGGGAIARSSADRLNYRTHATQARLYIG